MSAPQTGLRPVPSATLAITVPGTSFLAFATTQETADKLVKGLRRTWVPELNAVRRRRRAEPLIQTVEEWSKCP